MKISARSTFSAKAKPRDFSTSFNVTWHGVPIPDRLRLPRSELLQMPEGEVSNYFQRYAAICIGNMNGAAEALPALNKMLPSEDHLVGKHADWPTNRIKRAG